MTTHQLLYVTVNNGWTTRDSEHTADPTRSIDENAMEIVIADGYVPDFLQLSLRLFVRYSDID